MGYSTYSDEEIKVNDYNEDDTAKEGMIWQKIPSMPRSREIVYSHYIYDRLGFSVIDDILNQLLTDSSEGEQQDILTEIFFAFWAGTNYQN